jgi:hypothetical protein
MNPKTVAVHAAEVAPLLGSGWRFATDGEHAQHLDEYFKQLETDDVPDRK